MGGTEKKAMIEEEPIKQAPTICRVCKAKMEKIGQDYICDRCGHSEPCDPLELE
jgi:predicted amidophosphoribosyltransferase